LAGSCEHGNELSDCIKRGEFLELLRNCWLVKKDQISMDLVMGSDLGSVALKVSFFVVSAGKSKDKACLTQATTLRYRSRPLHCTLVILSSYAV
jgi:hypothetical protein